MWGNDIFSSEKFKAELQQKLVVFTDPLPQPLPYPPLYLLTSLSIKLKFSSPPTLHRVQFLLSNYFWEWSMPWNIVKLLGATTFKKIDFPVSYQMPVAPPIVTGFCPTSSPLRCDFDWHVFAQVLRTLSQLLRTHVCNCPVVSRNDCFLEVIASSSYTLFVPSSEGSLSLGEKGILDHLLEMLTDPQNIPCFWCHKECPHPRYPKVLSLPQQHHFTFAGIIAFITSPLVDFRLGNLLYRFQSGLCSGENSSCQHFLSSLFQHSPQDPPITIKLVSSSSTQ